MSDQLLCSSTVQYGHVSERGRSTIENMDSCAASTNESSGASLFVVADGMGGPGGGKLASEIAVKVLVGRFESLATLAYDDFLRQAITAAHKEINNQAKADPQLAEMGTTVVAAIVHEDSLFVAHVGDSRATLYREDCCYRLTADHLAIVEFDGMPENRAKGMPGGNELSRAVGGGDGELEIDSSSEAIQPGDVIVLCSDGVTEVCGEDLCYKFVFDPRNTPQMAARAIVDTSVALGSTDHCTAVVVRKQ